MTMTLDEIRARKERHKITLQNELESITKQLQEMGALKIILFGSLAHGNVRSWSDLDLIAIMRETKTGKEWMKKIYEEVDRYVSCDILAYTEKELERMIPLNRFVRHAIKTGKVIYERKS